MAVALGLTAGIFSSAFFSGMMNQRVKQVISNEISSIQIHDTNFRETTELEYYIPEASLISEKIKSLDNIAGVSNRIIV